MFTCLFIYKQFTSVNKYKDIKTLSLKAEKNRDTRKNKTTAIFNYFFIYKQFTYTCKINRKIIKTFFSKTEKKEIPEFLKE